MLRLVMLTMPGSSYRGDLPDPTGEELRIRDRLAGHVRVLAEEIGPRSVWRPGSLERAREWIEATFRGIGLRPSLQEFEAAGRLVANVEVELKGREKASEIVVIGAHYDTVEASPGANDNGSGVAALLELARLSNGGGLARTVRLVAFVNEEPPFFQTDEMGSRRYAVRCRERSEDVVAMLALETLGFYSEEPGSQSYPFPLGLLYPDRGDFVGFVADLSSRSLVREVVGSFREHTRFPSEAVAAPALLPGIGWSDHWAFWQEGYPAVMVTDTALYRDDAYHTPGDLPHRLDFDRMSRVVAGLARVVRDLAGV